MGVTLETEQALGAAKMTKFFEENRAKWTAAARKAYEYVKGNLPKGSTVRRDGDAKFLTRFRIAAFRYLTTSLSHAKSDHGPWWFAPLFCAGIFLAVAAVVLIDLLFSAHMLSVE
jgi:hypothetical protein